MTKEQPTITQGDILATEFDRIRLAFDSVNRDRNRLKAIITSLRVNAIKSQDTEALLAFMRDGLDGINAGLTIGEMITAYEPANTRTTSLAAQDGLVERVARAIYDADEDAITANINSNPNFSDEAKRELHESIGPKSEWPDIHPETREAYLSRAKAALSAIKGDKS